MDDAATPHLPPGSLLLIQQSNPCGLLQPTVTRAIERSGATATSHTNTEAPEDISQSESTTSGAPKVKTG